jgi:hypothetical protein
MKWCFFLVYGPADHRRTDEFLDELTHAVAGCQFPVVIGGISTSSGQLMRKIMTTSVGRG